MVIGSGSKRLAPTWASRSGGAVSVSVARLMEISHAVAALTKTEDPGYLTTSPVHAVWWYGSETGGLAERHHSAWTAFAEAARPM